MEHQKNSWPGRSPKFERLEGPRRPQPEYTIHQLPPSSQSPASERRSIEPRIVISGSQRQRICRRRNRAPPVESLVHRLKRQSLKSLGHSAGGVLSGDVNRRIPHLRRQPGHDVLMMDCDKLECTAQKSTETTSAAAQIEQQCDQTDADTLGPSAQHHSNILDLEPERPPSPPADSPSVKLMPGSAETEHHAPLLEVDPKQKLECKDLDLDEGYGAGTDELIWTNDGHSLIQSLANHARKSGALVYRTSSEAAMDCSQIVYKAPRMRRRRHKNHTRLQESPSINAYGIDRQNIINPGHPADGKNQP
ncbi:uncharacterized protein MAM_03109 [Metarhizium album ARSEF 1941]|uniref:Uncharacterized protein n=1 Tax=Metarhizium album (strain ARSEF 1941) TaxID=1081103 RepID=A0A0B2WTK5_METAS|nr:uncharacterized protein MAM_03109 [Metarhizium album ARSEF 1941]KHN99411.1 hypothetical protein MAM_03109 [Metarhizium album ARSEF 1941]